MGICRIVGGSLIWIVYIIPFVVLQLVLMSLYKLVLIGMAKCIRGENGVDQLHSLDPFGCMLAPDSSAKRPIINIGFLLIVQGRIEVEEMREHFKSCFLVEDFNGDRYEKLYSHLETLGGYVFRATASTLDINEHVVKVKQSSTSKLNECLMKWVLQEWKPRKPCWKLAVIPLDDGETTGIAFKIHHALADNYSLIHILDKMTGSHTPYRVKDFGESRCTQLRQIVEGPCHYPKMLGMEPSKNPFRITISPEQRENLVCFTSFKLEEMERLCEKFEVKMDSVLLTILSGALRKFLEEEGNDTIAEEFCVQLSLPWPKHPAYQSRTSNKNKLCNHWSCLNIKVTLREPKPELRIKAIDAQLHKCRMRFGLDKFAWRATIPPIWALPRSVIEMSTMKDTGVAASLTSVVGAEEGYSLLGKEVTNIHPWCVSPDGNPFGAFGCTSFSHRGKMELTFDAHPSVFKDQKTFNHLCKKLVHEELQTLLLLSVDVESSSDLKYSANALDMV